MASCLLTKLVLPLHQTTINSCQLPRPKHFIKPLHHQGYHRIHYCVYQKPHHKYTIHLRHIFTGIIKTKTTRYIRLSITFDDFDYIHKIFRLRLQALDYPPPHPPPISSQLQFLPLAAERTTQKTEDKPTATH